jgi:serine/threonine protein kinase
VHPGPLPPAIVAHPPRVTSNALVCGGRYQLLAPQGQGGMASVWRAARLDSRELFAVKVFHFDKMAAAAAGANKSPAATPDAMSRERYVRMACREIAIHEEMRHPNVVPLLETFSIDRKRGTFGVVMELAEMDLQKLLDERGPLPEPAARRIAADIVSALAYIWDRKVVHGDLKPSNVLLARDGRPMLSDFGISREAASVNADGRREAALTMRMGSEGFIAPEMYDAGTSAVDSRVDVYALAKVLFRCLTGTLPAERKGKVKVPIRYPSAVSVSREAQVFIELCVGKNRPGIEEIAKHPYIVGAGRVGR